MKPPTVDNPMQSRSQTVWPATADGVDGAVHEAQGWLRYCYGRALARDPSLRGIVDLSLVVRDEGGIGRVVSVDVIDADLDDADLEECLVSKLERLAFDPPLDGDLVVDERLRFESTE